MAAMFEEGRCVACDGIVPNGHQPDCPYRKAAADAMDSATGIAAPLLAGFTITLIGLVVPNPQHLRWTGWSLLLLTVSVLMFITCVQAGFWARRSRPEVDPLYSRSVPELDASYVLWTRVARETYDVAIVLLLCGLGTVVAPTDRHDRFQSWTAAGLCLAAAVAEVVWHFAGSRSRRIRTARRR
ncbi:hypothetical protein [Streptomyces sp. NPDC085540]|uniref:hypothetical protein n=1 Tax=Streptomyces sp. NPDC085540 TaxID=3365730 RepID=UPI0037D6E3BC